jgi:Zn-dependent peptidase ImmA (M78 family)/DNA-binding XRE family transcriptional regulator
MATDLAPVTPSVLKWARESIGASLEEAAKRAGVTPERVDSWERGDAEPTVAKLRDLGKLYQRPLAVFFLPEPPREFDTMRDFRKLPGSSDRSWSRPLHKVFRRALEQQDIVTDLLDAEGEEQEVAIPSTAVEIDPEQAAANARTALHITLDEQFSWRNPDKALAEWITAVEDLGIFVLRTSDVALTEMRGFSLGSGHVPAIVINALDARRGQIFTLLHEFVHLMVREGGLCNLLEQDSGVTRRIERFCNATASAILMPAESFLTNDIVRPPGEREWSEDQLEFLSTKYGASKEAVLRRLVTLRRASWDFYLARRDEYLTMYEQQREEERARRRQKPSGPPPYRMVIRDRGKPYVRMVLDAYHRDAISPANMSRILGMKLKHLPALEHEVRVR